MNSYISIATKISISFFLGFFLFFAFSFLFFSFNLALAEDQKTICNNACVHAEQGDDCFNNCMNAGVSGGSSDSQNNIDIACENYQYPWCSEAKEGIAPLVKKFYTIALGLAAASALGVLIYGAILWTLSGAVSSKQDAKEWISGALWGLALLLGAYLILFTINPQLIELKEPEIKEVNLPEPPNLQENTGLPPELSGFSLSHQQAQAKTDAMGIKLRSSTGVIGPKTEGSTSLEGAKENTVDGIIAFKGACSAFSGSACDITITGGTEYGHTVGESGYNHANGYKLDIQPNSQINDYIMNSSRFKELPPRGTDPVYQDKVTGYVYVREDNHWDVSFVKL